ncbi:MAG: NAD-dependent epimerase/dehydratase family protein [Chloroflexi bacterium]|nr:NAD-dependent epimerase/dehydratase family protein [Chloroflexota bacterium]
MRILILGGTSFIGPAVVRTLASGNHDIAVFHRGQTEADLPPNVVHIHCEDAPPTRSGWKIQSLPKFLQEFKKFAPDVVLDMVPFSEHDIQTVVDTFRHIAHRIVAISSCDVYRAFGRVRRTEPGLPDHAPLTEDAPLREKFYPYRSETLRSPEDPMRWMDDYDKILVERIVMNDPDLPGTVLRLPMVYGPRDTQHRLFEYLKRMDDNRPAILLDESIARWHWTRGYVENVATAIAHATTDERAVNRIYNVGEAETLSIAEWVRAIGDAAGWYGEIITVAKDRLPSHLVMDIDTNQELLIDTARIRKELGYSEAIDLEEALKRTVAWERANPLGEVDAKKFDYAAEDAVLAELK